MHGDGMPPSAWSSTPFIIRQPNTYAQGFGRGAFALKPMEAREVEEAVMHAGAKHEEQVEKVVLAVVGQILEKLLEKTSCTLLVE